MSKIKRPDVEFLRQLSAYATHPNQRAEQLFMTEAADYIEALEEAVELLSAWVIHEDGCGAGDEDKYTLCNCECDIDRKPAVKLALEARGRG